MALLLLKLLKNKKKFKNFHLNFLQLLRGNAALCLDCHFAAHGATRSNLRTCQKTKFYRLHKEPCNEMLQTRICSKCRHQQALQAVCKLPGYCCEAVYLLWWEVLLWLGWLQVSCTERLAILLKQFILITHAIFLAITGRMTNPANDQNKWSQQQNFMNWVMQLRKMLVSPPRIKSQVYV